MARCRCGSLAASRPSLRRSRRRRPAQARTCVEHAAHAIRLLQGPGCVNWSAWISRLPLAPRCPFHQVDLSDATLAALKAKVAALDTLRAQRAAHAANLMSVLASLWDACGAPPGAPERAGLAALMAGPHRLHARSLERCVAEVRRCEEAQVVRMVAVVNGKARCDGGRWGGGGGGRQAGALAAPA